MEKKYFHHALKFRKDICIGCSHCMNVCPTRAIRIRGGKAELTDNYCVDCGKCYRACPVGAIIVEQDDFNKIFEYPYRVALIPSVLVGQFPENVSLKQISSVMIELGFTHVYEVEHGVELLRPAMSEYIRKNQDHKPLISSFCPAIVRLIQVRFPSLTENLILLKAPLDIAAAYFRKKLLDEGAASEKIGIFYITPCAAKIAAVKSPVGDDVSPITGVINMDFIFNKVYTSVKKGFIGKSTCEIPQMDVLRTEAIKWPLTNGEADRIPGRSLAIDEISNVMEFLEKLENEENDDIDFLEMRACDQSCAGGILTSSNRFLTVERMKKRGSQARIHARDPQSAYRLTDPICTEAAYLNELMPVRKILPRSMDKLDEDISLAMKKMKQVHELQKTLPYVDCGLCGSPTCNTLAEDVVQGRASIKQCVYVQKRLETQNMMMPGESISIMKDIWGEEKFKDEQAQS